ncbi:MAG: hypothetical protein MR274_04320 [Clostridium sp.]|nr:hypothetical protein [Clostridium sp.]MDY3828525.1 hypothetical protein [Clostridium sp.]
MQKLICSKVELYRNFKDVKFVDYMDDEDLQNNIDMVSNVVNEDISEYDLKLIKFDKEQDEIIQELLQKRLVSGKFIKKEENAAVFINEEQSILLTINEDEHLKISSVSNSLNLKEEFENVDRIDDIIGNKIQYAFSEKYGYLASKINKTGNGLKATVILSLPLLEANKKIPDITKRLGEEGIVLNKIYNAGIYESNLFQVYNQFKINVTESEIIEKLQDVVQELLLEERQYEEKPLYDEIQVKDRVFRAEAILKSARLLTESEMLNLIADIRMGINLSIMDISNETLDKIVLLTRTDKLEENLSEPLTEIQRNMLRAQIVRDILG